MPRTVKRKRTVKKKVARKKPKRKATKAQLVTKLVKETQQLQKAGYSKEEILLIVASSIGGLALLTGIGLGGAALAKRMKKSPAQYFRDRNDRINAARDERIKELIKQETDPEYELKKYRIDRDNTTDSGNVGGAALARKIKYDRSLGKKIWDEVKRESAKEGRERKKRAEFLSLISSEAAKRAARRSRMARRSRDFGKKKRKRKRKVKKRKRKRKKRKRKRKVKKRRKKRKFGRKVSKKPSAALRRMCKRLKVRLTVKRGKKRVYKSEKVLKKQCKTAMKRKK
tara:strand:+ start:1110 stop:1961 length:852 start_codon:yes stop_codon:yes gene_type:complete